MDEKALQSLSVDHLLTQMIQLTNDVVDMHKKQDSKDAIKNKLREIQLIQKIIVEKRHVDN